MKYTLKLIALSMLICSSAVTAQVPDLNELLDQAVSKYPSISARRAEAEAARHNTYAAMSEYIPRISAQHQYTYGTSNSMAGTFYPNPTVVSPSGGIRTDNVSTATWGTFTSALAEWNIYNFGKVSGNVAAAREQANSANEAYANELFQHKIKVADTYLLALASAKLVGIQQANYERAQAFRKAVDASVISSLRPGVDSSLAHAESAKAQMLLLESERYNRSLMLQLMELTGTTTDIPASIDSMSFLKELPSLPDDTSYSIVHPSIRMLSARARAAELRAITTRRSILPSITLVGALWARGSGVYNDDTFHTDFASGTKYQVHNYMVGIATRWVISDFSAIRQRYKSESALRLRDEDVLREQQLRVQRQRSDADMQFEVALQQARTAPVQLAAARHAYRQAEARYQSGLSDLPTLLQAMVSVNRAEADFAIAYTNSWRALLAIAASRGDFSIFEQAIK